MISNGTILKLLACPTDEHKPQHDLEQSFHGAKSMHSTQLALRLSLLCASVKYRILTDASDYGTTYGG